MPTGQPATDAGATPARPPRVVLADADDADRARTTALLVGAGCTVVAVVGSHAQAMVAARTHQPDVIVTDLRGGTILGPAAYLTGLRGQCPTAAIVVYSSVLPSAEDLAASHAAAGLVKGVDAGRLPAIVQDVSPGVRRVAR